MKSALIIPDEHTAKARKLIGGTAYGPSIASSGIIYLDSKYLYPSGANPNRKPPNPSVTQRTTAPHNVGDQARETRTRNGSGGIRACESRGSAYLLDLGGRIAIKYFRFLDDVAIV